LTVLVSQDPGFKVGFDHSSLSGPWFKAGLTILASQDPRRKRGIYPPWYTLPGTPSRYTPPPSTVQDSLPFMTAGGPLGTLKVLTCVNVTFVRGINPGWDTQVRKEASSPWE